MPAQTALPLCEKCRSRLVPRLEKNELWCQICGHVQDDPASLAALSAYQAAGGREVYHEEYEPRQANLPLHLVTQLREAWDSIQQEDYQGARFLLQEVLRQQRDSLDAYYLLAFTTENPQEKRDYLASALAFDPHDEKTNFELAKLRGLLEADRPFAPQTLTDARAQAPESPAQAERPVCPMCGGALEYQAEELAICVFCGYHAPTQTAAPAKITPLSMAGRGQFRSLRDALLVRRFGGGREWQIAKRVLACGGCGAQLTLSGQELTQACAFCGGQHVLIGDAHTSFQTPDAVLPACLGRSEASALAGAVLPPFGGRVVGVESLGVFLPYWNFRGTVEVKGQLLDEVRFTRDIFNFEDLLVYAAQEPTPALVERLQPYDLRDLRPYDQRYLARWSASLYTQDAIQASVSAKTYAQYAALHRLKGGAFPQGLFCRPDIDYRGYDLRQADVLGELDYRLVLLPVWMVTFSLERGGVLVGAVNAQTGKVVWRPSPLLGTQKPPVYRDRGRRG